MATCCAAAPGTNAFSHCLVCFTASKFQRHVTMWYVVPGMDHCTCSLCEQPTPPTSCPCYTWLTCLATHAPHACVPNYACQVALTSASFDGICVDRFANHVAAAGPCLHLPHHGSAVLQGLPLTADAPHRTCAVERWQAAAGTCTAEQAERGELGACTVGGAQVRGIE